MNVKYKVDGTEFHEIEVEIDDPNCICIAHTIDGRRMFTSFSQKKYAKSIFTVVTISHSGDLLHVRQLSGCVVQYAVNLLKLYAKNKIIHKNKFISYYQKAKMNLVN